MAWGAEGVDNWYKSPTGRVSQNWPLATIDYWDLTRVPDPGHYRFGAPVGTDQPAGGRGVTTVVMGNCGVGFAPCRGLTRRTRPPAWRRVRPSSPAWRR